MTGARLPPNAQGSAHDDRWVPGVGGRRAAAVVGRAGRARPRVSPPGIRRAAGDRLLADEARCGTLCAEPMRRSGSRRHFPRRARPTVHPSLSAKPGHGHGAFSTAGTALRPIRTPLTSTKAPSDVEGGSPRRSRRLCAPGTPGTGIPKPKGKRTQGAKQNNAQSVTDPQRA